MVEVPKPTHHTRGPLQLVVSLSGKEQGEVWSAKRQGRLRVSRVPGPGPPVCPLLGLHTKGLSHPWLAPSWQCPAWQPGLGLQAPLMAFYSS